MRSHPGRILLIAALATLATTAAALAAPEGTVLRLEVPSPSGTRDGTCFVVYQEQRGSDTVSYFLTSAGLFADLNEPRARIIGDDGSAVEVGPSDILVSFDAGQRLAIVRAVTTGRMLQPVPVVFESVRVDDVFLVTGYDPNGRRGVASEYVTSATPTLVSGGRTTPFPNPEGAPALVERGVFGVVVACESGCTGPQVLALSAARDFLDRHIPGLRPAQAGTPQFAVSTREISGPLLRVPFGDTTEGEVDVPLRLAPGESILGASASLIQPRSIRLGDVTVVDFNDRSVKLRFTIGGAPPPPQNTALPQAQALVSIRVGIVTMPVP